LTLCFVDGLEPWLTLAIGFGGACLGFSVNLDSSAARLLMLNAESIALASQEWGSSSNCEFRDDFSSVLLGEEAFPVELPNVNPRSSTGVYDSDSRIEGAGIGESDRLGGGSCETGSLLDIAGSCGIV
jgi:hypothetical protein